MAVHFAVTAQTQTVLVRSPTLVEDVIEIHAVTKPHGVTFVRDVPIAAWRAKGVGPLLEPIAAHIEHIMTSRPVLSAGAVQDLGTGGLIANYVDFVVHARKAPASTAQLQTATVRIPVQALHDRDEFESYFKPVLDALDATAAL